MRKTVITIAISITLAVLFTPTLAAQAKKGKAKAKAGPTPIEVTLNQISDRRTTSHFSQLDLNLALSGITMADVSAARVVVLKAVDDTGLDLVDHEAGEPQFASTSQGYDSEEMAKDPATIDLVLKNPSRDAVLLKEVSGEVELYMPKKDPAATATIAKFTSAPGKPLASRELKAAGIEIVVLGTAQLEAEKQKGATAKRAELTKEGYEAESIEYYVKSFEEYFPMPQEGDIAVRIKDPNARIHELTLIDAAGEEHRAYMSEQEGLTTVSTYGQAIGDDWSLKVSMRTPKTMAKHTFKLADVELP